MLSNELLYEAEQLRNVSTRLELVADRHVHLTEKLIAICTTIQSSAILLEVLVVAKLEDSRPIESCAILNRPALAGCVWYRGRISHTRGWIMVGSLGIPGKNTILLRFSKLTTPNFQNGLTKLTRQSSAGGRN